MKNMTKKQLLLYLQAAQDVIDDIPHSLDLEQDEHDIKPYLQMLEDGDHFGRAYERLLRAKRALRQDLQNNC